jgi:hypothetical protein
VQAHLLLAEEPAASGADEHRRWPRAARAHGIAGPDRWKERSRFYPGIAKAMAEQWGGIISEDYPQAA